MGNKNLILMVGILLLYFLMINPLNGSDGSDSSESSEPEPDDDALTPAGSKELPSVGSGVADGIINIGNNTLNQVFGLNRTYTA